MNMNMHRLLKEAAAAVPEAEWLGLRRCANWFSAFSAVDGKFDLAAGGSDEGMMVEALYKGVMLLPQI